MSKIVQLNKSYDLWLTYTWSGNDHGICGHTYEVIDYYYILKDKLKVGIFLAEDIDLEKAIRSKYNFTEEEICDILDNTIFGDKPSLLQGNNILFTDGGVVNNNSVTLLFDHIFYFACGNKEIKDNEIKNVYVLQDDRVYDPVKLNGINYKKRILFSKLKRLKRPNLRDVLIYGTKNCRGVPERIYKKYSKKFKQSTILAVTNEENQFEDFDNVKCVVPPVEDLFNKFHIFVYTPVPRKWDCSPRFLAECKHYNKNVIFEGIDYWDEDKGLYWRNWDIENDFESLHLTEDDEIIHILEGII